MEGLPPPLVFTEEDLNGSLNARFAKMAAHMSRYTGHPAYCDPTKVVTYHQLFETSLRLAAALANQLGPEAQREQQLVALLLDADWTELPGLVGTILAGHYYVALDPQQPMAQYRAYFTEYPIRALVSVSRHAQDAMNLVDAAPRNVPVIFLDDLPDSQQSYTLPQLNGNSINAVYFTSGSTGKPRGVLRSHGGMLHTAYLSAVDLGFVPGDHISLTMPVALGMSLTATLGALLNGVTIHRRNEALSSPGAFYQWLREDNISIGRASAGLVRGLASLPDSYGPLASLRMVDTGGDAFTRQEIERLFRLMAPGGSLNVRLASNEAGNYAMFRVKAGQAWSGDKNPAGYPPRFIQVNVVDENQQPLPAGETGELVVRSRYMAVGYINDPAQSAARFLPAPGESKEWLYYTGDMGRILEDGCIEFLGRKDFRVKVRGFTIELEAVESALRKLEHVRDAIATVQTLSNGNKRLAAFIVMEASQQLSISEVRQQLTTFLPNYMVPSVLQEIKSIPLTATGKPDRKNLPLPVPQRPTLDTPYHAPKTENESKLASIWEKVLGISAVGVDDNFFELGGDSLISMQMLMEVETLFNTRVPQAFFNNPTIAHLEKLLRTDGEAGAAEQIENTRLREQSRRPSRLQRIGRRLRRMTRQPLSPEGVIESLVNFARHSIEINMLSKPYEQGLQWLARWSAQPFTQNNLYRHEKTIFQAFFSDVGHAPENFNEIYATSLVGNILASHSPRHKPDHKNRLERYQGSRHPFWKSFARLFEQPGSEMTGRFVSTAGLEHLQAAFQRGQGVILLSYHGTCTHIPSLLLPHWLGRKAALVLSPRVSLREEAGERQALEKENAALSGVGQARFGADIMVQGYRALQNGEVIQAFVDNGFTSQGEWPLNICGRRYMTRAGWADLAARTSAPVIPIISTIGPDGHIHIEFLPAFKSPANQADHEARVLIYMNQYGVYLSQVFKDHPEALNWRIMQNHLAMPSDNGQAH